MKGILFRQHNIDAIRDGRKTMTRRIIKAAKGFPDEGPADHVIERAPGRCIAWWGIFTGEQCERLTHSEYRPEECIKSRYLPGEALYVKRRLMQPAREADLVIRIESVRLERLQDITEADAIAEGLQPKPWGPPAVRLFALIWDEINGIDKPHSWDANPWVWVYQFKVVEI
jgi:hypothetical protein